MAASTRTRRTMRPRLMSLRSSSLGTNLPENQDATSRLAFSLYGKKNGAHALTSPNASLPPPFSPDSMSRRSRSSGVTALSTFSGQDPFDQPADHCRIDFILVRYHHSLQRIMTEGRDPPGRALGVAVNLPDSFCPQEIPAGGVPRLPATKRNHRPRVRFLERSKY